MDQIFITLPLTHNVFALAPDQFDLGAASAGSVAVVGHNDTALTAATLTNSYYPLTLHKADASDVDYFRINGAPRTVFGVTSERPVDVELSDASGAVIDTRLAVTSANFLLYSPSQYIVRVSGARPTRYVAGVGKLPADFDSRPLKLKFKPKPFDPGDPPPKIVLLPRFEEVFDLPRGILLKGSISVKAPGEIELVPVDAVDQPIAKSKIGSDGRRVLEFPKDLPNRAYYLRVRRDDRDRAIGLQPVVVLDLGADIEPVPRPARKDRP